MTKLLTVLASAVVLVGAASAQGHQPPPQAPRSFERVWNQTRTFWYDRELAWWAVNSLEWSSRQSGSRTKAVPFRTYVRCYSTDRSFEERLLARGASQDEVRHVLAYYDGKADIHLRNRTCAQARSFVRYPHKPRIGTWPPQVIGAMTTLLHETLHRQGFEGERATQCFAIAAMAHAGQLQVINNEVSNGNEAFAYVVVSGLVDRAYKASRRDVARSYQVTRSYCNKVTKSLSWADYQFRSR